MGVLSIGLPVESLIPADRPISRGCFLSQVRDTPGCETAAAVMGRILQIRLFHAGVGQKILKDFSGRPSGAFGPV